MDSYMQKNETKPLSYPNTKINWKGIKVLTVKPKTIKSLEENIGDNLIDISLSEIFVDLTPEARERKAKIENWDYIKLKSFCIVKEIIIKKQPTVWEKIFTIYMINC